MRNSKYTAGQSRKSTLDVSCNNVLTPVHRYGEIVKFAVNEIWRQADGYNIESLKITCNIPTK